MACVGENAICAFKEPGSVARCRPFTTSQISILLLNLAGQLAPVETARIFPSAEIASLAPNPLAAVSIAARGDCVSARQTLTFPSPNSAATVEPSAEKASASTRLAPWALPAACRMSGTKKASNSAQNATNRNKPVRVNRPRDIGSFAAIKLLHQHVLFRGQRPGRRVVAQGEIDHVKLRVEIVGVVDQQRLGRHWRLGRTPLGQTLVRDDDVLQPQQYLDGERRH